MGGGRIIGVLFFFFFSSLDFSWKHPEQLSPIELCVVMVGVFGAVQFGRHQPRVPVEY